MKGLVRSYRLFQAFRNERTDPDTFYRLLAVDTVEDVSRYCQLVGATVLDVGGGAGYVADAFREVGSRSVTAEYDLDRMAPGDRGSADCIAADGAALPLATGSVDVSYSSNVLEHVLRPHHMLSEMVRVVPPGGMVYLTFTNWLSPWGGHDTSPWHYISGSWAAKRYQRVHGVPPKNRYGENLFNLGVGQVLGWCQERSDVTVVDAFPRYYPRWTKAVVRIPGLREFLTWNLVVVMRRTNGAFEDPVAE
jgi:SAM-dependent methyltransferase